MHHEAFECVVSLWDQVGAPDLSKTLVRAIQSQKSVSLFGDHPFLQLPTHCCQAVGGDPKLTKSVSSAWRILYFAAYLLDGVADGETPVSENGVNTTLAAACLSSAGLLLTVDDQETILSKTAQSIQSDFQRVVLIACNGQINDLTRTEPTLDQCWQAAREKTGEFYALASRSGARVATDDQECIALYSDFGLHLGMLIQIGDDMNGLWPKNNRRSDLFSGKWTLPVAYAMEVSSKSKRELLQHYLGSVNTDPIVEGKARQIIIESGAILYLVTMAEWHYSEARSLLAKAAHPGQARDELIGLLDMAIPKRST